MIKIKKRVFYILQGVSFLLLLNGLSCGRSSNTTKDLNHDFLFGVEEGLYRTKDLKLALDERAIPKSPKGYENILDSKENLYKEGERANISSLKELLKVTTVAEGEKVKIFSNQEDISIDSNLPFINEYEILDYTVEQPKTRQQEILKKLLGKIRNFKGFPNTDYYILPSFLGNYLILYKLSLPDKVPYEELPLSKRIGDMLAVPLVGYPVESCQAVKVLGSNNIKETLKFRPVCKALQSIEFAEYVRLWDHDKQSFQYQKKLNFFPRDFFDGKWLYFKTSLDTATQSFNNSGEVFFKTASLVEFQPAIGKMDVIEVNNLKQDDEKRLLFIPVKWRDYEIARDSERLDSSFSERTKDIDESDSPYLEIQFDKLVQDQFDFLSEGGKSLKSVVISKDYISFDIEITAKNIPAYLVRYSFKRYVENSAYKQKRWFETDSRLFFPLYFVEREYYKKLTDHTREDLDRFKRVIRFDPQSKEIVWRFSKQSSKESWVRELAFEAERLLNRAFSEAGEGSDYQIKITLDPSEEGKNLGDIRYNILNLILSENESVKQFPQGNNIANPFTGEVVSATANVWLTPILNEYIHLIRRYIRFQVYPSLWKMPTFSQETMNFLLEMDSSSRGEGIDLKNLQCFDASQEPLGVTPFLHEKINHLCKEVVAFIDENQGQVFDLKSSLKDKRIVKSCSKKLAKEKILQILLKRMLYSHGLKQMLSASFDSENFYNLSEIESLFQKDSIDLMTPSHPDLPQYSSVMDVMDYQYPTLSVPGKLDISALRFLYFDKIHLKNQENCLTKACVLEVPSGADSNLKSPQKSILKTALEKGYKEADLKKHKMCSLDSSNPITCGNKDYGTSLVETATNKICDIHNHILADRNRYDAKEIEITGPYKTFLTRMYVKWEEYRDNFLQKEGKLIEDYSFLDPDHVEAYRQIVVEKAKEDPEFRDYNTVRKIFFDYIKRLAFTPSKHCIYKTNDSYQAIALENIEEKILLKYPESSAGEREEFRNCESEIVQEWVEENLEESELVAEVGFFGKERRYLIRPNEKTDPVDEIKAFNSFMSYFISPLINPENNIFQEPDLTAEYYKEWLDYVNQGLDLNPYIVTENNIKLERVLSYKIDTMGGMSGVYSFNNLWHFRFKGFERYRDNLKEHSKTESLSLFKKHFYYQAFSLTELKELADSIQTYPELYKEIPFFTQAYEEYNTKEEKGLFSLIGRVRGQVSFESFIKDHPAVLYDPEKKLYRVPYEDSEKNILSKLFRKYNRYSECIKKHFQEDEICDDLEEKQAFIRLMLETKDAFFQQSL